MVTLAATSYLEKASHEKQHLKQRCFHAYLIGTGTGSMAARI